MPTVEVVLRITAGRSADRTLQALDRLTQDPAVIAKILVDTARQTLVQAYLKRFHGAESLMTGMERETGDGSDPLSSQDAGQKGMEAMERLKRAEATGDEMGRARARRELERLAADFVGEHVLDTEAETSRGEGDPDSGLSTTSLGGKGSLATGQFTPRMRQVLALLTTLSDPVPTADGAIIGIGPLDQLEKVQTPSYTTERLGKPTKSRYTVLWRQLEYGTGIYRKPSPRKGPTRFKTPRGTWFYGPGYGQGLHLRGNRPANVLRKQSGLSYEEDAIRFKGVFFEQMNRILRLA